MRIAHCAADNSGSYSESVQSCTVSALVSTAESAHVHNIHHKLTLLQYLNSQGPIPAWHQGGELSVVGLKHSAKT